MDTRIGEGGAETRERPQGKRKMRNPGHDHLLMNEPDLMTSTLAQVSFALRYWFFREDCIFSGTVSACMAASRANRSRSPSRGVILHARHVVIVPMQGRRFSLDVLGSDTIDSVKAKIYDHMSAVAAPRGGGGLVPELQRLQYYRLQAWDASSPIEHYRLSLGNQDCGWLLFL